MSKKVVVIGAGFSGLSAAACLAQKGYEVTVLEKNESAGGRASLLSAHGFNFDMGPSWYWMPDVFEKFFQRFGKTTADFYTLKLLDPSYRIFWGKDDLTDIPADFHQLKQLFNQWEPGSADQLEAYMKEAAYKYQVGINELVYKPGRSLLEFADWRLLSALLHMHLFTSVSKYISRYFHHEKIRRILEFPVYFLGALPKDTPALYTLMNYADLKLNTWYPMGGMYEIVKAMESICRQQGVTFLFHHPVKKIVVNQGQATSVLTENKSFQADIVLAAADYHHVEQQLLDEQHRHYSRSYWNRRILAPSALIFYLGISKKLKGLLHHNLFFDESFELFAQEIYAEPRWPSRPLFYVCVPSITDASVAPAGHENLFLLIPVAPGLTDEEHIREKYYDLVMSRLQEHTGERIREYVIYKKSFAHHDFEQRYHAWKGNAYGLANTLFQTALFKPSIKSHKVKNLYFTGQLTVPGPGVPPCIISGQVVCQEIVKENPL